MLKGYRTIIFNFLTGLAGILAIWQIDIPAQTIDEAATGFAAFLAIGNIIMRSITSTPVGKAEPPPAARRKKK